MINRFNGKTAIVTGGCRGIGKSIVLRLALEGATVYAADFKIPEENEIFIENSELQSKIHTVKVDVTDFKSITDAFEKVVNDTGRIDILVNNAGITRDNLVLRMTENDWDTVINTNLKGTFLCSKAVARQMMSQREGRIINVGSIVGSMGNAGQANYSASKAGLIGLTKSLAKEFASRNILVNCVAPGYVITHMTEQLNQEQKELFLQNIPLKRGATADDIANVVTFFASEDSSYVTGQLLHVDGGLLM